MKCPKCDKEMVNKGNIDRLFYTSLPAQWDEAWVCEKCKVMIKQRVCGTRDIPVDLSGYEEIAVDKRFVL